MQWNEAILWLRNPRRRRRSSLCFPLECLRFLACFAGVSRIFLVEIHQAGLHKVERGRVSLAVSRDRPYEVGFPVDRHLAQTVRRMRVQKHGESPEYRPGAANL